MKTVTENIFGMKISRTADQIGQQGREAYWQLGLELDALLNSLALALYEHGPKTSSEITKLTGFSRQREEARLKKLVKSGYATSRPDPEDARRTLFEINPEKAPDMDRALAMMKDFEQVYEDLWQEIGVDMGEAVAKLERALTARPLLARLCEKFPHYVEAQEGRDVA
ncbi:MAG: MarR family transcriptional regulator [Alphaproteobacteria bacterium]|nr:MarR family transcriptional regulator [Alphaproteobacteria bacterium]